MIIPKHVHPSWTPFLTTEIQDELRLIESHLDDNINPTEPENILRFLATDLTQVKVIWLGQDVYPARGVATGRSFEVGNLTSWDMPFRQVSVKNIIRLIHKSYNQLEDYRDIKSFTEIKKEIREGIFPILQPKDWFDSLENQGVLFLNTAFTCEIDKANSHRVLWRSLSKQVLQYISEQNPTIRWFLWGKDAKANKQFIEAGSCFESRHPMMCSEKYADDFLKSPCFEQTWQTIRWLG